MKVNLKKTEVFTYALTIEIEREGKKYEARVFYDLETGYEVEFWGLNNELLEWPQWALDKEEASDHSLGYELESAVGGWFQWVKEEASK